MDALVVATALEYLPAVIVTGDPGDMSILAQGHGIGVVAL
jgi:hypothetical protein